MPRSALTPGTAFFAPFWAMFVLLEGGQQAEGTLPLLQALVQTFSPYSPFSPCSALGMGRSRLITMGSPNQDEFGEHWQGFSMKKPKLNSVELGPEEEKRKKTLT